GSNLMLTDLSGSTIDVSSIPGATGNATSVVTVPMSAFSSASRLILDMREGVDGLTIDLSNGNPVPLGGILYVGDPPLGRGDKLTIIVDDQGTLTYAVDPLTSMFVGAPEGSGVVFGSMTLFVTYHGGDGNDVEFLPNDPPTASGGGPYAATYGDGVTLDASASADPDNDALAYSWTINGHANAATGAQPSLSWQDLTSLGLSAGNTFAVSVTIDDSHGHVVTSSEVALTVNRAGSVTSITVDDAIYDGSPHGGSANWISTSSDLEGAPLSIIYVGTAGTTYGP